MFPKTRISILAASRAFLPLLLAAAAHAQTIVSHMPGLNDGHATASVFNGTAPSLTVNGNASGPSVAWITFQTAGLDRAKIQKATLALLVKSVGPLGTLRVHTLTAPITALEANVPLASLSYDANAVAASLNLTASDVEKVVNLDITAIVKAAAFTGVALTSINGMVAEFGSKESLIAPAILLAYDNGVSTLVGGPGVSVSVNAGTANIGLQNGGITQQFLATGAVGPTQISNGAVQSVHIAPNAVGSAQIAMGSVGPAQIASSAVGPAQLANGAVGTNQIAAGAVGMNQIAAGAVGVNQLANGAVGNAKLGLAAVASSNIANGAVGGQQLATGAVATANIANGAVDNAQIKANAVRAASIQDITRSISIPTASLDVPVGSSTCVLDMNGVRWASMEGDQAGFRMERPADFAGLGNVKVTLWLMTTNGLAGSLNFKVGVGNYGNGEPVFSAPFTQVTAPGVALPADGSAAYRAYKQEFTVPASVLAKDVWFIQISRCKGSYCAVPDTYADWAYVSQVSVSYQSIQ
jgi:hypothetical protein